LTKPPCPFPVCGFANGLTSQRGNIANHLFVPV
jgi:hypothetical protein